MLHLVHRCYFLAFVCTCQEIAEVNLTVTDIYSVADLLFMHLPVTGLWLDKIKGTEKANNNNKALIIDLFAARTQDLTAPSRDLQLTQVKMLNFPKPMFWSYVRCMESTLSVLIY